MANYPLWLAECDAEGITDPKRRSGKLRSLAIRWWRNEQRPRAPALRAVKGRESEESRYDRITRKVEEGTLI